MKIINLMEDTSGNLPAPDRCSIAAEHGFSVYIETPNHKILVDTGASDKTWNNAAKLGVDITLVDTVFLSHGHYDHSGGLMGFAKANAKASIYMTESAPLDYYNLKSDQEEYIGIDKRIAQLSGYRLIRWGAGRLVIDEELSAFGQVTGRRKWPQSNLLLKKKVDGVLMQDDFCHEMYVVVRAEGKSILISGCAHNGILNILDRYRELYGDDPDMVISGFHMMKAGAYNEAERQLIVDIAEELRGTGIQFYTGHCTGLPAYEIMKGILGDQLRYVHSGDAIMR